VPEPLPELALVTGGDICRAYRTRLADGTPAFVKELPDAPARFFEAEATGLRWLGSVGAVCVPEVIEVASDRLVLSWVEPGQPTLAAAEEFGRALAHLHSAGADSFGAPWAGFIGSLPMDNSARQSWVDFYAENRVLPFLRAAVDRAAVDAVGARDIERVVARIQEIAGSAEPPARIHGDLWGGNVHWSAGGPAYLIDPAAHGGHRETDLAMLQLFGAPHVQRIIAAYHEHRALADGWRERVALHQFHPLLVHAVLFGSAYGARAVAAARRYL
jgi:fructosamine-3-kinase